METFYPLGWRSPFSKRDEPFFFFMNVKKSRVRLGFGFVVEYNQGACVLVSKSSAEPEKYSNLSDFTRFFNK